MLRSVNSNAASGKIRSKRPERAPAGCDLSSITPLLDDSSRRNVKQNLEVVNDPEKARARSSEDIFGKPQEHDPLPLPAIRDSPASQLGVIEYSSARVLSDAFPNDTEKLIAQPDCPTQADRQPDSAQVALMCSRESHDDADDSEEFPNSLPPPPPQAPVSSSETALPNALSSVTSCSPSVALPILLERQTYVCDAVVEKENKGLSVNFIFEGLPARSDLSDDHLRLHLASLAASIGAHCELAYRPPSSDSALVHFHQPICTQLRILCL